jgi:hypothetical protein
VFTLAGTESGIFFIRGERVLQRLVSLELKLDDFTSGFWITYADTAGGCEEVVAVGSGIGTGAGTGVELNKKGKAEEAPKNNGWSGVAAEGKMVGRRGRCRASKLY